MNSGDDLTRRLSAANITRKPLYSTGEVGRMFGKGVKWVNHKIIQGVFVVDPRDDGEHRRITEVSVLAYLERLTV